LLLLKNKQKNLKFCIENLRLFFYADGNGLVHSLDKPTILVHAMLDLYSIQTDLLIDLLKSLKADTDFENNAPQTSEDFVLNQTEVIKIEHILCVLESRKKYDKDAKIFLNQLNK